jgi:hypothetical protein
MSKVLPLRVFVLIVCVVIELVGVRILWRQYTFSFQEKLMLSLAVLAITFAIFQFFDAHAHTKKMKQISESTTTRSIGSFPRDVDHIVKVVADAEKTLLIMADYLDYGRFTKPEGFDKYAEALMSGLKNGVEVKVLIYTDDLANTEMRHQFSEKDFPELRDGETYKHFFKKYKGIDPPPSDYDGFIGVLTRKHKAFVGRVQDLGADVHELDHIPLFFFWIEDLEDTVFAFQNVGVGGHLRTYFSDHLPE